MRQGGGARARVAGGGVAGGGGVVECGVVAGRGGAIGGMARRGGAGCGVARPRSVLVGTGSIAVTEVAGCGVVGPVGVAEAVAEATMLVGTRAPDVEAILAAGGEGRREISGTAGTTTGLAGPGRPMAAGDVSADPSGAGDEDAALAAGHPSSCNSSSPAREAPRLRFFFRLFFFFFFLTSGSAPLSEAFSSPFGCLVSLTASLSSSSIATGSPTESDTPARRGSIPRAFKAAMRAASSCLYFCFSSTSATSSASCFACPSLLFFSFSSLVLRRSSSVCMSRGAGASSDLLACSLLPAHGGCNSNTPSQKGSSGGGDTARRGVMCPSDASSTT
ncbi:hypothetical protein GE09DRAFT_1069863 [Coniochaeta sp. 2T2.1]|nr:hypothetical protein GE09DRAFT_1069863 [Coniochaeta sp. 2T2.1]